MTILDLSSKRIRNICRGSDYDIQAMEFSKDGSRLVSTGRANVMLWDSASGRRLLAIDAGNTIPAAGAHA